MTCKSVAGTAGVAEFFDDLVRCETRLYNALNERLRAAHGIVASQFEALRFVRDHPGARVIDLAAHFAAGIGAISRGIDRLERDGWVARERNPNDRRSSLLALTDAGAGLVAEAERTFAASLTELIGAALDGSAGPHAARVLRELRTALERDRTGLPVG